MKYFQKSKEIEFLASDSETEKAVANLNIAISFFKLKKYVVLIKSKAIVIRSVSNQHRWLRSYLISKTTSLKAKQD